MIVNIGNGTESLDSHITIIQDRFHDHEGNVLKNEKITGEARIKIKGLQKFVSREGDEGAACTDAINWLYPDGFNTPDFESKVIISATNDKVDLWNDLVQLLNERESIELPSADNLCEVDDPYGFLKEQLTEDILNRFHYIYIQIHNALALLSTPST